MKVLITAGQMLDYRPKVTRDNLVVIPEQKRKAAEEAIEIAANLIAVAQGCRRKIASPEPCVVFIAQGADGRKWLEERSGIHHKKLQSRIRAAEQLNLDEDALNALTDRTDGVSLLVEALAQDHAMGRFHDFIRVFERAFATPAKKLTEPVANFLDPRYGYTKDELRVWFEEYRDPATHADARRDFLLETDVLNVIDRMEQAAIDVLFNKEDWRDPGDQRRETWAPDTGTLDSTGGVFLTKGAPVELKGQVLDEYGAFPLDLQGIIEELPPEWWPQARSTSRKSELGVVRVLEPKDKTPSPEATDPSSDHKGQ